LKFECSLLKLFTFKTLSHAFPRNPYPAKSALFACFSFLPEKEPAFVDPFILSFVDYLTLSRRF